MANMVLIVNCGIIFALFGIVLSGNVIGFGTQPEADPDVLHLEACDDTDGDGPSSIGALAVRMKGPDGKTHRIWKDEGFIWITPNGPSFLLFSKDDDGPGYIEHIYTLRVADMRITEENGKRLSFNYKDKDECWIEFKTLRAKEIFLSFLQTPPPPPSPPREEPPQEFKLPSWMSDPALNEWYPNLPPGYQ